MTDYDKVPGSSSMAKAMQLYLEEGYAPGHFLTAVLTNDFVGAVGHADRENLSLLREWAMYLYNEIPSKAWGSKEKLKAYIEGVQDQKLEDSQKGDPLEENVIPML
tara:strand:- start:1887 stop:2204 length:318 start_codon:yes stop_codon:yes gene_type:complete